MTPQQIPLEDVKGWITNSLELMKRKWISFVMFQLVYSLVIWGSFTTFGVWSHDNVMLDIIWHSTNVALVFFFFTTFIVVAYQSDHSENVYLLKIWQTLCSKQYMSRIGVYIGCLFVMVLFTNSIGTLLISLLPENTTNSDNIEIPINIITMTIAGLFVIGHLMGMGMVCVIVTMMSGQGWTIPLMLFTELSIVDSVSKSFDATRINYRFMNGMPILGLGLVLIITQLPIIIMFLLPFIGTIVYVSFRHIFLGKPKNEPIKLCNTVAPVGA